MNIYAYTTETYREFRGWVKVGQTKNSPESRVAHQDQTACPEELEIEKTWRVPGNVSDHGVHRELEKMGCKRVRSSREWFEATLEQVDKAVSLATEFALSPEAFVAPTKEQKDDLVKRLEAIKDKPCLTTTPVSDNLEKSMGISLRRLKEKGLDEGFIMVWCSNYHQLTKITEFKEKYYDMFISLGIELIFTTQEDY